MAILPDRIELTTPADGDLYVTTDVSDTTDAATGTDKKITWANIKATLKTYYDTLYATVAHTHTGVYAPVLGADDNYVTDAEKTVIGNTSGTNTGDNAVNSNYSGLVTNATHTGDATGSGALTVVALNGTNLAGLTTGVLKNTTATGVPFISKVAITEPATSATLTIANGKTLTANNSIALTGTDSTTMTFPSTSATIARTDAANTFTGTQTITQIDLGNVDTSITRSAAGIIAVEGVAVPLQSITNTHTAQQIELGHATDTTITRTGAGAIAVEGVGVALNSISLPHTTSQIELGHATDTTITRVSAGVAAIEGNNIVTTALTGSTTQAGIAEASIASEVNTGNDAARYVSPDSLAGSNFGIRYAQCTLNGTTALTTSEKCYFRIPAALTGMNLVSVAATVGTGAAGSSSSGTPTFTVKNVTDGNQMLSTSLTVDAGEYTSATAVTAAVIDATKDDVVTDDLIEVAVTTAGTGTQYAVITLGFALP